MDEWNIKRILIKNLFGGRLLEYFLISAVSAILVIRFYLKVTGYPEVGSFLNLHVAHVLWGGILMMLGVVFILAYLSSSSRTIGAIISGIGFGAFIDEIGKFITRDNNYFFQPTAAIIYAVFIILFLVFRNLDQKQKISKQEYLANALELLEDVVFDDLDTDEKNLIKQYLKKSDSKNPLVINLKAFIDDLEAHKPDKPILVSRVRNKLANFYQSLVFNKWFIRGVVGFFFITGLYSIVQAFQFGRLFVSGNNQLTTVGVSDVGEIIFALVAAVPILIGASKILRDRLFAYRMFRYSVLINIFLVEFFEFYQNHFSAVGGLFGNILLLIALNYMISREITLHSKD